MRAIINGFRYDTEKAQLVGEASHGYGGDHDKWEAGLYVTPRARRYFLAGWGGPMSRFARRVDNNSYSGGEGIHPMTRDEAYEWAEQHLDADELEAEFGDMIEDA